MLPDILLQKSRQCGRSAGLLSLCRGAAVFPLTEPWQWLAFKCHQGNMSAADLMLVVYVIDKKSMKDGLRIVSTEPASQ